jgi:hypothetical protein
MNRSVRRLELPALGAWSLAVAAAGVAVVLYHLAQGLRSYIPDEGIYGFVGWSWLHGDWPYRDAWDHKGPLVYLAAAMRIAVLGTAPERLAIQEIVLGLACAMVIGAIAWRLWGTSAAAVGFAAGVLIWAQRPPDFGHMSTTGSVTGLANAAGVLAAVSACRALGTPAARRWLVWAGLCGGLAFCAKPNAPTCVLVALLAVGLGSRRALLGAAVAVVVGFLIPIAGFVVLFLAAGAFSEMIDAVILYNLARGAGALDQLGIAALAKVFVQQLRGAGLEVLVLATALVAGIASISWIRRQRTEWVAQPLEWIVPAWVALELAVFASNGAFTHHIYGVVPAIALAIPWLMVGTARTMKTSRWAALAVPLTLIFGTMLLDTVANAAAVRRHEEPPAWRLLADWLRENTEPDERVLAFSGWGEPGMLTLAERRSATRYFHPTPLWAVGNVWSDPWSEIIALLEAPDRPRILILSVWGLPPPPAGGETVEWALGRLDRPLVHDLIRVEEPSERIPRVKRLILERYDLLFCRDALCALKARTTAAEPDQASAVR